jgi:hypothetical protein
MLTGRGEVALALDRAAIDGRPFPPDVPDTPRNRELFGQIVADVEAIIARGLIPDIPAE